jgi:hypothetical protein
MDGIVDQAFTGRKPAFGEDQFAGVVGAYTLTRRSENGCGCEV